MPRRLAINPKTGELCVPSTSRDGLGGQFVPITLLMFRTEVSMVAVVVHPAATGSTPTTASTRIEDKASFRTYSSSPLMLLSKSPSMKAPNFPRNIAAHIFASEHGSWNRSDPRGYE